MTGAFNKPVVCPILIGRTDEIAVFHKLIDEAKSSKEQAILLCGEAGIGKSRLVAELKTEAATLGLQSLPGHGFPTDSSCPYTPLANALRSVFLHNPCGSVRLEPCYRPPSS